jgi:sigma-E factor negative regulatory protein RseB
MPSYVTTLAAALSLYLVSTNSYADDLFDMLKRMSEADQNRNYQGTFILRKSDKLSTLFVTHGVDDNGVWESLESLNGEKRKVIQHNKRMISVYPERELITIRDIDEKHSLHRKLPGNLDQLTRFYTMTRLDDDRIADHKALVIELEPKDQYRYGYRYWVDEDSGMLLRCDLLDEQKSVIEQMMFTSLDFLPETPTDQFDLQKYQNFRLQQLDDIEPAHQLSGSPQWSVKRLPKGFMLTQVILRNSPQDSPREDSTREDSASGAGTADIDVADSGTTDKKHAEAETEASSDALLHMVYSDGLASVSVFIEQNDGESSHLQGASSVGAVNAYGNAVDGHFVTVVGEVPASTVESMAQSTVPLR